MSKLRRARRLAPAMAALAMAGCGLEAPEPPAASVTPAPTPTATAAPGAAPQFLTLTDVRKRAEGSPDRAVLAFWRAVQYRDLLTAYKSLSDDFRTEFAGSLRRFGIYVMADHARWLRNPVLMGVERRGRHASVYFRHNDPAAQTDERAAFTMVREGGRWRVAYEFYLANRLKPAD